MNEVATGHEERVYARASVHFVSVCVCIYTEMCIFMCVYVCFAIMFIFMGLPKRAASHGVLQ